MKKTQSNSYFRLIFEAIFIALTFKPRLKLQSDLATCVHHKRSVSYSPSEYYPTNGITFACRDKHVMTLAHRTRKRLPRGRKQRGSQSTYRFSIKAKGRLATASPPAARQAFPRPTCKKPLAFREHVLLRAIVLCMLAKKKKEKEIRANQLRVFRGIGVQPGGDPRELAANLPGLSFRELSTF